LERAYRACGYPVKYFTETAAAERNGRANFFSDLVFEANEWGGSIVKSNNNIVSGKKLVYK